MIDSNEIFERARKIAEGKIKCECGNTSWREFLYIEAYQKFMAGCKKCAGVLIHEDEQWRIIVHGPKKGGA